MQITGLCSGTRFGTGNKSTVMDPTAPMQRGDVLRLKNPRSMNLTELAKKLAGTTTQQQKVTPAPGRIPVGSAPDPGQILNKKA